MNDKLKDWLHVLFAFFVFCGFLIFCLAWYSIERAFRVQMANIAEARAAVVDNLDNIRSEQEQAGRNAADLLAARSLNMAAHATTLRAVDDMLKTQKDILAAKIEMISILRDIRAEVSALKKQDQVLELRGTTWLEK